MSLDRTAPPADAGATWRDFRRRRLAHFWAFFGPFFVLCALAGSEALARRLGGGGVLARIPGFVEGLIVLAAVWLATGLVTALRVVRWPCPRCGKPFLVDRQAWRTFLWNDRCAHCRLPVGAPVVEWGRRGETR